MADWKIGLFGCFSNLNLCLITFLVPCITVGQIAEDTKTDEFACGALKSIAPIYSWFYIKELRDKVAEENGIEKESCCNYFVKAWCCGICLIIQTGHEAGAFSMGEDMERQ